MASRRDVLPAWSSLPRVVLGHVTEYLDVRALGVSACVGQYTLRSAVATAWCRRAGGGVKSAGAAIRILQREVRERAMLREPVAVAPAAVFRGRSLDIQDGSSLDDLKFRFILQGTRADGSKVSMDWGDVAILQASDGEELTLGIDIHEITWGEAGQIFSQTPTPGKLSPSSAPFLEWLRAIANDDEAEAESAMRHGVNASVTVRRGDAVVELARFGVGGSAHLREPFDTIGGEFIYRETNFPTVMRLQHTEESGYDLSYPREWSSEYGYVWNSLCCDVTVAFDAMSGGMEPKGAILALFRSRGEGPGPGPDEGENSMGLAEIRHTLHALLDAELVRAARADLPAEVPFP
jgi:hypothetical protein